jgi:hypothetical protein
MVDSLLSGYLIPIDLSYSVERVNALDKDRS